MRESIRLLMVLTLISAAAGAILAYTNKVTRDPIARAARRETVEALGGVLPDFDNDPARETVPVQETNGVWTFHVARLKGQYAGTAFITASRNGYGGEIRVMVGVNAWDQVRDIRILSQLETPGLGTKVAEPPFLGQFKGRAIGSTAWSVRKDGGNFDAVTGATISSRAVLEAIRTGLAVYTRHRDTIRGTAAP